MWGIQFRIMYVQCCRADQRDFEVLNVFEERYWWIGFNRIGVPGGGGEGGKLGVGTNVGS